MDFVLLKVRYDDEKHEMTPLNYKSTNLNLVHLRMKVNSS